MLSLSLSLPVGSPKALTFYLFNDVILSVSRRSGKLKGLASLHGAYCKERKGCKFEIHTSEWATVAVAPSKV